MALARQDLEVPLVGGVDQKTDARLATSLLASNNLRYAKKGTLTSRYGVDCKGALNLRLDGSTPAAPELVAANGAELVRVGGGKLDTYALAPSSEWVLRDRCPEAAVFTEVVSSATIPAPASALTQVSGPDIAVASGYAVCVYANLNGTTFQIVADVVNLATGAKAMARTVIASSSSQLKYPKVVATPGYAWIFWSETGGHVGGRAIDLSTLSLGIAGSANGGNTAVSYSRFDVCVVSSSVLAAVYERSSGTNRIEVRLITLTGSTMSASTAAQLSTTDTAMTAASIATDGASYLWVAVATNPSGTSRVYAACRNPTTLTSVAALTTLHSASVDVRGLGVCDASSLQGGVGTCIVAWDDYGASSATKGITYWTKFQSNALGLDVRQANFLYLLSRPFLQGSRVYAHAANYHATHGTQFLVDLAPLDTIPSGSPAARIVSVTLPRQLRGVSATADIPRVEVSNAPLAATGEYLVGSLVEGEIAQSQQVQCLRFRFNTSANWRPTAVRAPTAFVLPLGAPSSYDGQFVAEIGMPYEPDVSVLPALSPQGGGSLTTSKAYSYVYVFRWTDAAGNVHRSAPSLTQSLTLTGTDDAISGQLPYLHLTNKQRGDDAATTVQVELYRTVGDGSTFYLIHAFANVPNGSGTAWVDNTSDATASTGTILYTTGGVASNIPSSATLAAVYKGATVLAGTDDDSTWISPVSVAGLATYFSASLTIAPFEGGRVTALANLDNVFVIFKSDSVFYLMGEPPAANGTSTLSSPQRIHSDVGCIDPRSVVIGPEGVYFRARPGLYLLTRDLQLVSVGNRVEDTVQAIGASVVAATLVPDDNLVRFVVNTGSAASALNYDYQNGGAQAPVWSPFTYNDPAATSSPTVANIASACYWGGAWTFITEGGHLYQEARSQYVDTSGTTTVYVACTGQLAHVKLDGLSGYQRVRFASLLASLGGAASVTQNFYADYVTSPTQVDTKVFAAGAVARRLVHLQSQKCAALSVGFSITPTAAGAVVVQGMQLQLGIKGGPRRLPATQRG